MTAVANVFLAARSMTDLPARRRFAELPVIAVLIVVAAAFGHVLVAVPPAGAVLLAVAVAGAVWARRFGPRGRRIGRLAAAPFVSVLIVPAPALAAGTRAVLLVPLVAIAGQALTATALTVARVRTEPSAPPPARSRPRSDRLPASTRQAIQILAALLIAFAVGFLVFGRHWAWVVITVYVVQFGARGRGDALLKAAERLGGAVAGTVVGVAVAALPLPDPVRIGLILVVLTAALGLRARSYVWWAAGMTTALALLYDVLGIGAPTDLLPRIGAVLAGGLIAVAATWFVLPVRSRDVLRRRIADRLVGVQETLRALRDGDDPAADVGVAGLAEVAGPHRAHARAARLLRREPPPPAQVLAAFGRIDVELARVPAAAPGIGVLERQVGALRRLNGRRGDPPRPEIPPPGPLRPMGEALDALWEPLSRL